MKKNMKRLINVVIAMGMAAIMVWPVLAVTQQNIHLPANQVWMTAGSVYRSGNRLNVYARCHSVYPVSGVDNFHIIQCRVLNSSGVEISDTVKLMRLRLLILGLAFMTGIFQSHQQHFSLEEIQHLKPMLL